MLQPLDADADLEHIGGFVGDQRHKFADVIEIFTGGDGGVDILWDHITSVHQAAGHVLSVARIALDHHGGRLENGVGDFSNRELFVVSLFGGNDGCI